MKKALLVVFSLYPSILLGLSAAHLFFPQRNGPLALTQVFAPYLFLPLILLVPLLFVRGSRVFRLLFLACVLIFAVRFLPRANLFQVAEDPTALHLTAMSWNMHLLNPQLDRAHDLLKTKPADVVALLEPDWDWYYDISNSGSLNSVYPYRRGTLLKDEPIGVVLLSIYPILEDGVIGVSSTDSGDPPKSSARLVRSQWARLDMGQGRVVTVVAAHPYPPSPPLAPCKQPLCYDVTERDAQIAAVRDFVGSLLARGESLILLGDFNVTDREPAYHELAAGLRDAHLTAGSGTGNTWRPPFLMLRELPILRIDYQFSSPDVKHLSAWTDCLLRGSDHCIVFGRFELTR